MTSATTLFIDHLETPVGRLAIVVDGRGSLRVVGFTEGHARMQRQVASVGAALVPADDPGGLTAALRAYFAGDLAAIDDLPVTLDGTPFQRRVWEALRTIPCGETWSYRDLAVRVGNPRAVRAVGLANGANPVGIVVPCHRVIGADGSLTGYGGGVERKRWLLDHERRARPARVDSQLRFA
jgi:methylated-DNA-[protein]-cysteine S-methyltransferase